ncbi:YcnI family protein [Phytohabitans houttuyneae]|uniref:Membrane protein n=1 Tax=Phytohabitans houttuyneae TaxID=1076126 RepID=A0A6V8KKQ7_9ACTN|nr:YcnI family protein [Phytohabitans houttuyneae]GFJ83001.1 membrane protein [Phytohabitans houttuyneae]
MRAARMVAGLGVAVLAGVVAAVGAGAAPASAHVTVNPREATQGGYAKLAFRVPNERDNASTTKVEVNIPPETAIASVSVRPTPGWTATVERGKLPTPLKAHGEDITEAVVKITWTAAAGSEVKPGQFQEFEVSAGPLPEVDRIVFKALQTYSNNEIVRWIEEPAAAGGEEPEHPAPVLKLAKAAATASATPPAAENANASLAGSTEDTDDGGNGLATAAGLAGLVAGLAGLVFGVLAWRRAGSAGAS